MMFCARAAGCARRTCMQMASFSACSRGGPRSAVELYGWSKTIGRCPCTPPSTLETFGEISSAEACSGKEITGLLKKMIIMTRKIVKSRVSGFSRAKLEAGRNELGLCTARDESKSCFCVFSRLS